MLRSSFVVLSALLVLGGCGNKNPEEKKVATQVAAKVNKEEIWVTKSTTLSRERAALSRSRPNKRADRCSTN